MHTKPFGEIIESSLTHWSAQSWQWDYFPPFASLIKVQAGEVELIGIIYDVKTGSQDPSRQPYAYQKTEQELRQEQPHIFNFLKTIFSCIPVGFLKQEKIYYQIPPIPPKIHAFVEHVPDELLLTLFSDIHFLSYLWHAPAAQLLLDELLLAIVEQVSHQKKLAPSHLQDILEQYSLLSGNDYRRLKQLSSRITRLI